MADAALGDVLSDAGLGLMKGLMGPSWEDEKRARAEAEAKAISERKRIESQTKLYEAEALYNARRQGPSTRPFKMGNGLGVLDENGLPVQVWEGPAKEPNEAELLRRAARKQMERLIGAKYGLPSVPLESWSNEDFNEPALDQLRDFAGVGRSPLATYPGSGGDIGPKRDVPGYGGKPGVRQAPPAKSEVAPPVPAEKPLDAGAPAPPDAKRPPKTAPKPAGQLGAEPTIIDVTLNPALFEHYTTRLKDLPIAEADKQYKILADPKAKTDPEHLVAFAEAYRIKHGKPPQGWAVEAKKPLPGTDTAPKAATDKPVDTTQQPGTSPTRQRNMPLTKEQQDEEARKREDQQLQRDAQRRSQALLDVTLRNEQRDNAKMAQHLKEYEEAKKAKNLAAQERIEKNILLETRDYRAQITGADETIALLQEMGRYVNPSTVGATGAVRQMWQNLMGQFERSHRSPLTGEAGEIQRKVMPIAGKLMQDAQVWQADENVRAKQEGRLPEKIYIPDYSKYDPSMTFIAFLKEVIGYAQARAMNGIGRLTDQDLDRAKFSLGIDDWTKSASHVQTSLLYVQRELKKKKERVQTTIDAIENRLRRHAPGAGESGAETGESAIDVLPPLK